MVRESYKPISDDEAWRLDAACRNHPNPRIFLYPASGRPSTDAAIPLPQDRAKAICRECPVEEDCLMSGKKEPGVRGGMVYNERKRYFAQLRRERRAIDETVGG